MDRKLFRNLLLLSLTTAIYMMLGAVVFQSLENHPSEVLVVHNLTQSLERDLMHKYNATKREIETILDRVRALVYQEREAERSNWTFYSSLYFVGSVITTIGELINILTVSLHCTVSSRFNFRVRYNSRANLILNGLLGKVGQLIRYHFNESLTGDIQLISTY